MAAPLAPAQRDLSPVELAKTAINEKLEAEGRFPPLEEYIGRTLLVYTQKPEVEANIEQRRFLTTIEWTRLLGRLSKR